ncbi:MAG: hypothetical protein ACTH5M_03715 [Psychrobacter sp.]|uniref:hypothetical protein n=1 Tax=Psychrobacter sp. AOP7-B1-24 TaxID=3457645 RepID=UPI003FB92009
MNSSEVFQKSDLGRLEVKSSHLGVLPREARTLLIMIDGKRAYQSYLDTLDRSKIFADCGGIEPLFELLLALECIEIVTDGNASAKPTVIQQASTKSQKIMNSQYQSASQSFSGKNAIEFNSLSSNVSRIKNLGKKSIDGMLKTKPTNASYETIKLDLATYIEKHTSPVEAWGYLLTLEKCHDSAQLLMLTKKIQNKNSGILAYGMDTFIKRIQR